MFACLFVIFCMWVMPWLCGAMPTLLMLFGTLTMGLCLLLEETIHQKKS